MEEVSAEKLARKVASDTQNRILAQEGVTPLNEQELALDITQAINKATEAKDRELESLCRQLEFTNAYLKENLSSASSRKLIEDNQALIDQVRLER